MPWTLRAQPATERLPSQPKQRVEVLMTVPTWRAYRELLDKVKDERSGELLLSGESLRAAIDELHVFVELVYFLDAQVEPDQATAHLPDPRTNRLGFFNNPETSGAPVTQRQSAIEVYPNTGTSQFAVLEAIATSEDGLADFELELQLHGLHQGISARRNALMNDGWIEDSGRIRWNARTRRKAVIWVLSEAGQAEWPRLPK